MSRNKLTVVVGSALVLLFCTPLWAQQSPTTQQQGAEKTTKIDPKLQATRRIGDFTVEEMVGLKVANIHQQGIGEIKQIAIGPNLNLYAIVSVGGFLGMGEETVAVPFRELQLDDENPDQVLITATTTKDSLTQQAAIYNPELYQPLDEDKLIAHFAGSEATTQGGDQQQNQPQSPSEPQASPSKQPPPQ